MPYVQRNDAGSIVGLYACAQPGYATEFLNDADASVVAFRSPPGPYASKKADVLLAMPKSYALGSAAVLCDAQAGTIANLLALQTWGTANPAATQFWVDNFGTPTLLTGAQFVSLAQAVGPFALTVYNALGTVLAAIAAGAITTTAQVDAAPWPS